MKTEREFFEEWHNKEYADNLEWDSKKEEYKDYIDEVMWQTWQASASREGYKLVPVEKVMDCLYQISDRSYVDDNVSELKAMIGAAP